MSNKIVSGLLNEPKRKGSFPMNIQFFAEGGNGDSGDNSDDSGSENDNDDSEDDTDPDDEIKFIQKDMNAIASKEKKQGRSSAFKDLGFKSEKEAKEAIKEYEKWKAEKMTDDEKKQQAEKDKNALEARAQAAEDKLSIISAGVRKDSVDDVLAIAKSKVNDDNTLDDVLESMKKEERYKSFFGLDSNSGDNKGTGSDVKHKGGKGKNEGIGARLAKQQQANKEVKSSYFK